MAPKKSGAHRVEKFQKKASFLLKDFCFWSIIYTTQNVDQIFSKGAFMQGDLFFDSKHNINDLRPFQAEDDSSNSSFFDRIQFTMTFDKIVIMSISLMVLFSVTFALGVEKGKLKAVEIAKTDLSRNLNSSEPLIQQEWTREDQVVRVEPKTKKQEKALEAGANTETTEESPIIRTEEIVQENATLTQNQLIKIEQQKRYAIQLVTYVSDTAAGRTAKKLTSKGYDAFIKQSGKYFVLNVGPFSGKNDADAVLTQLRKDLKLNNDGFVRSFSA